MSKKWEYAIEKTYPFPASEKELDIMGTDGWELCGVLVIQEEGLFSKTFIYYFKRLKHGKLQMYSGNDVVRLSRPAMHTQSKP